MVDEDAALSHIVLASHLPGAGRFRSQRHKVVGIPCKGELDYGHGWQFFWQSDRVIVNVEHDMECSDELVDGLVSCPHNFCTYAYTLHPASTGKPAHYAQALSKPHIEDWITQGTDWCAFTGIGFCKMTPQARVRPLPDTSWQFVDCAISRATDCPVHVHWKRDGPDGEPTPVEHFHQ